MKILLTFGIALLISGCLQPSLHPLFTEKDLVFDPGLIGAWVAENEKELTEAISDFRRLINNANSFLEEGSELIKDGDAHVSGLQQHLTLVLQNFEAASDNLNRLIDALADHPSQLIFGNPPPSRRIEP